jgi:cytochrome c556
MYTRDQRSRRVGFAILVITGSSWALVDRSEAQAPPPKATAAAPARASVPAAPQKVAANLGQLMKGILYPSSNVIFAAQDQNPADVPQAKDPSTATNPLASSYGKWEAVENASLALSEAANLLSLPGRKCANGLNVPIGNADWPKFVQGLRDAGQKVYKAAQMKSQDGIVDAADTMTTACSNCHDKYREKPNLADRCK